MRIVRWPEAVEMVGLSDETIYRLMREGKFPKKKKLSKRNVGWLYDDIVEWMLQRPDTDAQIVEE